MFDTIKSFKEILQYLWKTKKWWLLPAILFLIIIGLLIVLVATSPIPIFIYPLV